MTTGLLGFVLGAISGGGVVGLWALSKFRSWEAALTARRDQLSIGH